MLLNNNPLQLNNLQTVKVNHPHKLKVMPLKTVRSLNPMELKCNNNKPLKYVAVGEEVHGSCCTRIFETI